MTIPPMSALFAPKRVEVSGSLANLFNLRWLLGRYGYDPCDQWDISTILGLPEGLSYTDGQIKYRCERCDELAEWCGEIEEFELGHYANLCGGSPRCCP